MKKYIYTVTGNPYEICKNYTNSQKFWCDSKAIKARWQIELERQHNTKSLIENPITIELIMHIILEGHETNKADEATKPYKTKLCHAIRFIEDVCTDIIFKRNTYISEVKAQRIASNESKSIIIIKEII